MIQSGCWFDTHNFGDTDLRNTLKSFPDTLLPVICVGTWIGILIFGLWPLGYKIPNQATLLEGNGGILFKGQKQWHKLEVGGVAYTPELLSSHPSARNSSGAISIAVKLKPLKKFTIGIGTIAVFCDRQNNLRLLVGQWQSSLIVRTYYFAGDRRGPFTEIGTKDVLPAGQDCSLLIASDGSGTILYAAGKARRCFPLRSLVPAGASVSDLRLFLGNDPASSCPWNGAIEAIAVYNRKLDPAEVENKLLALKTLPQGNFLRDEALIAAYNFRNISADQIVDKSGNGNTLVVPIYFKLRQPLLQPLNLNQADIEDILINIFGFVPLGLVMFLWLRQIQWFGARWTIVAVVGAGFLTSLGIEWAQSFLPTRNSSWMDLICNTLGVTAGAAVGYWVALILGSITAKSSKG